MTFFVLLQVVLYGGWAPSELVQNMMPFIRSACVEMFFSVTVFFSTAALPWMISPAELNLNVWSCLANLKGQFMN